MTETDKPTETKKDRECIHCKKFFDCKGKPKEVQECVNFEKREKAGKQVKRGYELAIHNP